MQRTLTVLPYAVRPSVDEHRTQRVCDGADVTAEQLGDGKADIGDERQQQQGDEHAQVERQGGLDDLLHRALRHGRADEQDRADRGRCRSSGPR